jgi:hypothetical protein
MHLLLFIPCAILCATVLSSCLVSLLANRSAQHRAIAARAATPARPSAQIIYFSARKTPLPSGNGTMRPATHLRLVSHGG